MKRKHKANEYLMQGNLRPGKPSGCFTFTEVSSDESSPDEGFLVSISDSTSANVGSFRILPYSDGSTVYFYAFEISPELRGHGCGTTVFSAIKAHLYDLGYRRILLQVSRSNQPAFHLYKNSGLHVIKSSK